MKDFNSLNLEAQLSIAYVRLLNKFPIRYWIEND